jgi:hypothetical protein
VACNTQKERRKTKQEEDEGVMKAALAAQGVGLELKLQKQKRVVFLLIFFSFLRFIGFIFSMSYTAKHFRAEFGTFKSLNIKEKQEKLYLLFSQVCTV